MSERYRPEDLVSFVSRLFQGAGLAEDRARAMADTFVAADLLGFTTHGMQRVPINLDWLDRGETRATGEPRVLRDRPGTFSWDADFLPGPWVVHRAMTEAAARARRNGIAAATLQRCTHVACLAAYLLPLLEDGLVGLMTVSTPDERFISPFGGREAVFSNNPVAAPANVRFQNASGTAADLRTGYQGSLNGSQNLNEQSASPFQWGSQPTNSQYQFSDPQRQY